MSFDADLGPIQYVVVTFDSAPVPTGGLEQLVGLAEAGRILVLDAEFILKAPDGTARVVPASEVGAQALDGASTGLIDPDDVAVAAESLAPGGVALALIFEDLTLLPVIQAWRDEGGTIAAEGPIDVDDLVVMLDATDSGEGEA